MSQSAPILDATYVAAADLSTKRYHALIPSAEYTLTTAAADAENVVGVQQDAPDAAGKGILCRHLGTSEVCAGAAFVAGAMLMIGTGGRFITATTGKPYHAIALMAATANGDIVEALLKNGTKI